MEIEKRIKLTEEDIKRALSIYIAKKKNILLTVDSFKLVDVFEESLDDGVILIYNEDN